MKSLLFIGTVFALLLLALAATVQKYSQARQGIEQFACLKHRQPSDCLSKKE